MLRNAQLDELLAAHRQAGGLSALPQPVGLCMMLHSTPQGNEAIAMRSRSAWMLKIVWLIGLCWPSLALAQSDARPAPG